MLIKNLKWWRGSRLSFLMEKSCWINFSQVSQNHSIESALLKVSSDILMLANSGQYTVLILLDLSSAFDTLDHTGLINRLWSEMGFSGSVLKWFSSFLSYRSFCVFVNNILSEMLPLSCGVTQGSVLGPNPILFLLYIGEIINHFKSVSYHFCNGNIQLYCSFKESELITLTELLECLSCIKGILHFFGK